MGNIIPPQRKDTRVLLEWLKSLCGIPNCNLSEVEMLNLAKKSCRIARAM